MGIKTISLTTIALVLSTNVNAATIYEQGINAAGDGHDPFTYTFAYDDFTIGDAFTIDTISVNALTTYGVSNGIGDMDWEIRSVSGGTPGAILHSGNVGTVISSDTGVDLFNYFDLIDYTIDIADINLTAGSYFLGVKANNTSNGDVHLTLINDPVNISQALTYNGSTYQNYSSLGSDYAFRLEGSVSAVPVPAAVWLFGSGLLGLVGVARRKVRV